MLLLLYLFIIVYWLIVNKSDSKSVNTYITLTGLAVFLISGLRNEAIYGDTIHYCKAFDELKDYSFYQIRMEWPKDPFFYVFTRILHPFVLHSYTGWLLVIAAVYIIPVTGLIRRYSPDPMISWVCFIYLGLFTFSMAGLRQTIAMGILLFGFLSLCKGKQWHFFICLLLAYLFHGTSLIFAIVYPFVRWKWRFSAKMLWIYGIAIVVAIIVGYAFLHSLTAILGESDMRYIEYGNKMAGSNYTYIIQQMLVLAPSLFLLRKKFNHPAVALFAHISLIALVFVAMSPAIAEMFRVSMYFSWANIILLAMALSSGVASGRSLKAAFVLLISFYLFVINGILTSQYFFFFENADEYISNTYIW